MVRAHALQPGRPAAPLETPLPPQRFQSRLPIIILLLLLLLYLALLVVLLWLLVTTKLKIKADSCRSESAQALPCESLCQP